MRNATKGADVTSRRGFSLGVGTARAWEVGFASSGRAWEVGFRSANRAWEVGFAAAPA